VRNGGNLLGGKGIKKTVEKEKDNRRFRHGKKKLGKRYKQKGPKKKGTLQNVYKKWKGGYPRGIAKLGTCTRAFLSLRRIMRGRKKKWLVREKGVDESGSGVCTRSYGGKIT